MGRKWEKLSLAREMSGLIFQELPLSVSQFPRAEMKYTQNVYSLGWIREHNISVLQCTFKSIMGSAIHLVSISLSNQARIRFPRNLHSCLSAPISQNTGSCSLRSFPNFPTLTEVFTCCYQEKCSDEWSLIKLQVLNQDYIWDLSSFTKSLDLCQRKIRQ